MYRCAVILVKTRISISISFLHSKWDKKYLMLAKNWVANMKGKLFENGPGFTCFWHEQENTLRDKYLSELQIALD